MTDVEQTPEEVVPVGAPPVSTEEPKFKVGDRVRVMVVGTISYDDDGKIVEDTRPIGTIYAGPVGHEIPDVISELYAYEITLDDEERFPVQPLSFNVEALEAYDDPKTARKAAAAK